MSERFDPKPIADLGGTVGYPADVTAVQRFVAYNPLRYEQGSLISLERRKGFIQATSRLGALDRPKLAIDTTSSHPSTKALYKKNL